jgi:hypothetical protein
VSSSRPTPHESRFRPRWNPLLKHALNPGAARKLIEILKGYDKNQYIISTHSPEIIAAADPDTIHLVRWEDGESKVECLDRKSIKDQRRILSEVGVRLSDVFGADRVVWVEGETEQECFPLIARKHLPDAALGTAFIAMVGVDAFTQKRRDAAEQAISIYERLSQGPALTPPTLAFSFDREARTEPKMADLSRRLKGKAFFLPRRGYENFLIHPAAIAAVLTEEFGRLDISPVPIEVTVREAIDANAAACGASGLWGGDINASEWRNQVDAAKLIALVFDSLSEGKLAYRKTFHSVELTKWLLANDAQALAGLIDHLRGIFGEPPHCPADKVQ